MKKYRDDQAIPALVLRGRPLQLTVNNSPIQVKGTSRLRQLPAALFVRLNMVGSMGISCSEVFALLSSTLERAQIACGKELVAADSLAGAQLVRLNIAAQGRQRNL